MPNEDVSITANFKSVGSVYPVILNTNPVGAGTANLTNSTDNSFSAGTKIIINATANDGYEFKNWTTSDVTLNNASSASATFTMPSSPVTVTANFELVKDNSNGGGSGSGGKDDDDSTSIITVDPIFPEIPEIVIPQKPENPGDPENIVDLVEDPVGKIIRRYEPYIQGYPEGDVRPSGEITRAEVMQVIYNLYGYGLYRDSYGDISSVKEFSDVVYGEWYSDAIAFCIDYGVVSGYSDGTIRPDEPITRAELSVILAKLIIADSNHESGLSDLDETWARDSINKLHEHGIVNGYPDGTFKPNQTTIRSEFTVMVNRLTNRDDDYYEKVTFPDLPKSHWAYDDMMNASNGGIVEVSRGRWGKTGHWGKTGPLHISYF